MASHGTKRGFRLSNSREAMIWSPKGPNMKVCYAAAMMFLTVSLVVAGGTGTPRKEDVPKYLKMLLKSQTGKERAVAAEMLGKRGAIKAVDVADAIQPLQKALE